MGGKTLIVSSAMGVRHWAEVDNSGTVVRASWIIGHLVGFGSWAIYELANRIGATVQVSERLIEDFRENCRISVGIVP